jgi:Zn-dependent protease with chaperone function
MSERTRRLVLAGLSAVAAASAVGLLLCLHRAECLHALTEVSVWAAAAARTALPLLALSLLVWMVRAGWLVHRAGRLVAALPTATVPPRLREALARTDTRCVVCVAVEVPVAFCAGGLRPQVVVSSGLVERLKPEELDAVLIHEQDHARRREPLARAVHQAAADVLFYVPLVRWWSQQQAIEAELRADRAAVQRLGARPVAGALRMLESVGGLVGSVAFAGAGAQRVAQILGEPVPRPGHELSLVGISVLGPYATLLAVSCAVQLALHLPR